MSKTPSGDPMPGLPEPSGGKHWPDSPWTLIRQGRLGSPADKKSALDRITTLYYRPVHGFFARVLRVWNNERLNDVSQDFFLRFVEKDFLKNISHEKSFRNFLKVACRRHYINWCEAERARKPKGDKKLHGFYDMDGNPIDAPLPEETTGSIIDEELRGNYLHAAIEGVRARLEADGKELYFKIFSARITIDGRQPTDYATLAKKFGKNVFDIRNHLSAARKVFRQQLLDLAAEGSEDPEKELADLGLKSFL